MPDRCLTPAEVEFLLGQLRYKDWRFRITPMQANYDQHIVCVYVTYFAEDNFRPGHKTQVGSSHILHSFELRDPKMFYDSMRRKIHEIEMHEADEQIRIGGMVPYNPHDATPVRVPVMEGLGLPTSLVDA